ncbi:MAG: ABC transporter permease [Gammaproteobacteria bacterium]|nr:ABC transporter permease [Gammaproteobacteria bacterium]
MKQTALQLNIIAIRTMFVREVRRFMRIKVQTILPSMITTALYYLIFGSLIGKRIGEMEDIAYANYITPGLLLMAVISNSYANAVSSFFSAKFQRHLEELITSPVSCHSIVIGYTLGGVCRGLIVAVGVYLVSFAFTQLVPQNVLICMLLIVATSIVFSLAGLVNGIFSRTFDDTTFITTFILVPLVYLGGVFYSVALLPPFWQGVSYLNPILYLVNGLRHGFFGYSFIHWGYALTCAGVISIALYFLCVGLIKRGIPLRNGSGV